MTFQDKKPIIFSLLAFFIVLTGFVAARILFFANVEVDKSSISIDPKISPLWINAFLYKEGYKKDIKSIKLVYTSVPQDLYRFTDLDGFTIKSFRTEKQTSQLTIYAQYDPNQLNDYASRATDAEVRESLSRDVYAAICASNLKDTTYVHEKCYSQAESFSEWLNNWWLKKLLSFQLVKPVAAGCAGTLDCGRMDYVCTCSGGTTSCTVNSDCANRSCVCSNQCVAGNYLDCSAMTNQTACQNRTASNSCGSGCNGRPDTSCTWYNSGVTPTPGGGGGNNEQESDRCDNCSTLEYSKFVAIINKNQDGKNGEWGEGRLIDPVTGQPFGDDHTIRASTSPQVIGVRCQFSKGSAGRTVDLQGQATTNGWVFDDTPPDLYRTIKVTLNAYATPGKYDKGPCKKYKDRSCDKIEETCNGPWYICPISNYPPTNLSPSGNISAGTQNITWTGQTGAENYTLVITNTSTNQTLVNQTVTTTSYSYTFATGTNYKIDVRANYYSSCGSSAYTTTNVTVPQPAITLSGRYMNGTAQVSLLSGSTFPSLSWTYSLGNQTITTAASSYSLSVPKPSSGSLIGTLRVTIPANTPYVCSTGTYNSKTCSYSVTVSSTSGNLTQDILVVPAVTISGNVYETTTSAPANLCSLPGSTYPNVSPASVSLFSPSHGNSALGSAAVTNGVYTLNNVRSDWNYDLRLSFSNPSSLYRCACPTVFGSTTTNCQYTSLNFSSVASRTRNFYLIDTRMAATAWFQIFGGNAFATGSIHSIVPTTCSSATSCADALMASVSSNSLSSGFPVSQATDTNSIQTTNDALSYHSYIHQTPSDGGRADNANNNSYQVGSQIQLASYQELLAKLTVVPEERTESTLDLASWRSASFWGSEDTHFIRVTAPEVLLTDQSHFTLTPGEKILVIVNGNLSIRNTGVSNTKITQVPEGAFLGFIVSGNITIENSVGADISLSDPSALPATRDNAQLSGVFYANEQLIVEAYSDPPDRKLIAAGSFVGRQGVDLQRRFEADGTNNAILNSYQAVENFIFRPDFVANWPQGLRIAATNWRQINPRYVPAE